MKRKILIITLFSLFIFDMVLVLTDNISHIDNVIYQFIISFKSDTLTNMFKIISFLASTKVIILFNVIIAIIVLINKKTNLLLITISSISSGVINNLVKYIIKRERPFGIALVKENFYSFPSGHSMISILFYGTIIYMLIEKDFKYKKVIIPLISIYILLVGISRIYLGVHYASDVIGGYFLASSILLSLTLIHEKYSKENRI
ncbi:MAG: phosphatase PAP2 family protein [Bacilli bacterium]|nr:phosphatase PAP2 family protein [Bacilli bacterium]